MNTYQNSFLQERAYEIKRISSTFQAWCHDVATGHEYVILDTETTGLKGEIIDLAIINGQGDVLYNGLLRPKCSIEYGALKVHHITESMVRRSSTFAQEWSKIHDAIKGKSIITYNARFDADRIEHTAKVHGVNVGNAVYYCAMIEYASAYTSKKNVKLEVACDQQGVNVEQEHRALYDTFDTLNLIRKCAGVDLFACVKCGASARLISPSGTRYCRKHGYCARKTCLKSVEKFVLHPRLGIYVCSCVVKFEEEMSAS